MSKERDLLKKILATGWLNNTISCEVDDLLTEPEPEPSSDDFMYNKLKESYDELVESSFKDFQRGYGAALTHAVYVKEPTRKPLSYDQIVAIIQTNMSNGLFALARAIEKEHGIGVDDE